MLDDRQVIGTSDLQLNAPNVSFSSATNFGGSSLSIRGIGRLVTAQSGEPGVSTHINEIPIATNLVAVEFFDLERVEILRGPQGTLFGRNATGGAINLVTKMPDFDDFFPVSFDLEAGDYSHERFKAAFNLPLHDTLAVRFAALSLTRDGYIENLAYNQVAADGTTLPNIDDDIDGRDYKAGRITVLWKPTDKFSAWLQILRLSTKTTIEHESPIRFVLVTDIPSTGCDPNAYGFDTPHLGTTSGGIFASASGSLPFGVSGDGSAAEEALGVRFKFPRPEVGLRTMHTDFEPVFQNTEENWIFGADLALSDSLDLKFLGCAARNHLLISARLQYGCWRDITSFCFKSIRVMADINNRR